MSISLAAIYTLIIHYGYFIIIPIAIIEGPIITVIAGFLTAQGYFNFFIVYPIIVVSDVFGDLLYYLIGRFGKKKLILKWGHRVGITKAHLEKLDKHFYEHSGKTLIFGKLTHSLGLPIIIGAGIAEMPVGRFLWFNFLGAIPKTLAFLLVGYYIGSAYTKINSYIDRGAFILGIVLIAGIAVFYFVRRHPSSSGRATPS